VWTVVSPDTLGSSVITVLEPVSASWTLRSVTAAMK
jgi:hypothetical protein